MTDLAQRHPRHRAPADTARLPAETAGKRILVLSLCLSFLAMVGCGTATTARPLLRRQSAATFALGGPVANVGGLQVPLPYAVGRYRYGVTDRVGVHASVHLLMAAFGVAAGDAGVTWHPIDQRGLVPCFGIGAGLVGMRELDGDQGSVLLPTFEATASYLAGDRSLTYVGFNAMCGPLPKSDATFAPYVGHELRVGPRLSVTVEARWYAAPAANKPRTVTYSMPIANCGALGFVGGVNYLWGGWYR